MFRDEVVNPRFDHIREIVEEIKQEALQNSVSNGANPDGFMQDDFVKHLGVIDGALD